MPSEFPKVVDLGPSGSKSFASKDELDGYLVNEAQKWQQILRPVPDSFFDSSTTNGLLFLGIKQGQYGNFLALLIAGVIFTSESKYWKESVAIRGYSYFFLLGYLYVFQQAYSDTITVGLPQNQFNPTYVSGMISGQRNIDSDAEMSGSTSMFGVLINKAEEIDVKTNLISERLVDLDSTLISLKANEIALRKELGDLREVAKEQLTLDISKIRKEIDDLRDYSSDAINRLTASLKEDALIETTSNYWKSKHEQHKNRHLTLVIASVLYAFAAFLAIYFGAIYLPALLKTTYNYYLIFVGITFLTIIFWAGRLLTRTMLSEQHLAGVSGERKVFIDTYLALIREGGAQQEERQLMLNAVFKSVSDGIIKDDGVGELSLAAIVSKFATSRPWTHNGAALGGCRLTLP